VPNKHAARRRTRRGLAIGAAVIAVASAGYLVIRPHRSTTSTAVAATGDRPGSRVEAGPVVHPGRGPTSYRITYRTDGGRKSYEGTTVLEVRRPFDARQENFTGSPPGKGKPAVSIQTLGRFQQGALVLAVPPAPPSFDLNPAASLPAASKRGLVVRRERRVIAGRACQVYRTGDDPASGALKAWKPKATSWNDVCLDAQGLVLEQVAVEKGAVLHRRVAVTVDLAPSLDDSLFAAAGDVLPVQKGGGAFKQVSDDSRLPGRFWDLPSVPQGFAHIGRYVVRPPQPELVASVDRERYLLGGIADAYTSDGGVLIVEQGSTLGSEAPFAPDVTAERVDLGALGTGEVILSLATTVVRVNLGSGAYVRVAGNLSPTTLIEVARSLLPGPGGTLTSASG